METKLTRESAARHRRGEWRGRLLRGLRGLSRRGRLVRRRRGGALARDLLGLGRGRRCGGAALFLRHGLGIRGGGRVLRRSRAGRSRLLAPALFAGGFRSWLLGRRGGGRRRRGLLLALLLPRA